jgi:hypothetical protein
MNLDLPRMESQIGRHVPQHRCENAGLCDENAGVAARRVHHAKFLGRHRVVFRFLARSERAMSAHAILDRR